MNDIIRPIRKFYGDYLTRCEKSAELFWMVVRMMFGACWIGLCLLADVLIDTLLMLLLTVLLVLITTIFAPPVIIHVLLHRGRS